MVDISSALCFMHNDAGERTAHGDVKLENILLFGDGHAKLCDLGAAESEDVSSTRGVMSMQYVSPERIEDAEGRASGSADVWALGIVLHFLLFGKGLFSGRTMIKLAQEIGLFQSSQIGTSCGEKERELLMRMLDPDCESRLTSKQLVESSILRCLINTTGAGWKLSEIKSRDTEKRFRNLEDALRTSEAKVAELTNDKNTLQHQLKEEQNARDKEHAALMTEKERSAHLQTQLSAEKTERQKDKEALSKETKKTVKLQNQLSEERSARQKEKERSAQLQKDLKKVQKEKEEAEKERNELRRKMEEMATMLQGAQPKVKDGAAEGRKETEQRMIGPKAEIPQAEVVSRRIGADAIEWPGESLWIVTGNVFTHTEGFCFPILSFSFGKVVARFTFTIDRLTDSTAFGIVASSLTEDVKGRNFRTMMGGAGWDVFEDGRYAQQNLKVYSKGSACAAGRDGQRVVLEADGRDGKRTLRLCQDGQTQPTFFSFIPVPFRFAIQIHGNHDSISIESVEELTEPTLTGGTTQIKMNR
ncbi:putative Protein kinase domain containing protein [Blattamonas nauphoetae]|uniref:Protein kinase domain-containing protein n=1 Tax=Blattamonas nauphoetae TaxID=2049346 RepID=A0ABQ9Y7B7_9EUKA|nr:putative Protein kinase domain containing protein [Blattamonas nauphoetae]